MKNLLLIITLYTTSLVTSCSFNDRYKYWRTEHFELDNQVLADNDKVKILYASPTPENIKGGIQAYKHLVVVSIKTGDTINLLSLNRRELDLNKNYSFYHQKHLVESLNMESKIDKVDIENIEIKPLSAVVRVPDHDKITDNSFPSIIGICKP